ncbi:MAG: GIY-YIG nuclease family protein [Selenomonadaceae bacterium]|nr:GIY-YIG nuclease family protein [Selenomonadaceae bacterium]
MKTEVKKHEQFGEVRTVVLDAVKWFAGRDVAITLGYKKRPDSFITKHVEKEDKQIVMLPSLPLSPSSVMRQTVVVNDKGVNSLCEAAFCEHADDIKHWLLNSVNNGVMTPQVVEVEGVRGYLDKDGIVLLNAADVARELGFVEGNGKFSTSGENYIRWERVNSYLAEFEFPPVDKDSFIPESEFYLLAMKAKNEKAKQFQWKVASKILPSIRKYGYYSVKGEEPAKKTLKPLVPVAVVYAVLFANMLVKVGITSDFYRRLKELRKETHQDIAEFVTTPFLTLDDARLLELTLKAKFFDRLVKGEFFNVDFDTVKAAILAPDDKFTKLLSLADRLPDSEEKTRLVLQAASLI